MQRIESSDNQRLCDSLRKSGRVRKQGDGIMVTDRRFAIGSVKKS